MDKLKPEFVKKKPFIKLDKSVAKNADKAFECFEEYSEAVEDVVTDKLPDLLERVEKVIKEMADVADNGKSQFDSLSGLNKVKGIAAFAQNINTSRPIPGMVKESIEQFKEDLTNLASFCEKGADELPKLGENSKKCAQAGLKTPLDCYKHIYGEIPYTKKERQRWEKYMKKRSKKKGWAFNLKEHPDKSTKTK